MGWQGFLCRSDEERGRVLDIQGRLRPIGPLAYALQLGAVIMGTKAYGWAPVVPCLAAALLLVGTAMRLDRFRRPEVLLAAGLVATQLLIGLSVALASTGGQYLIALVALPTVTASVLFPPRVTVAAILLTALLVVGLALGLSHPGEFTSPPSVYAPVLFVVVFSISATQLRSLNADTRSSVVVDRLTGLLNRAALTPRVAELAHQSSVVSGQVAVLVGDVDRFKAINDEHGHAAGDAVLRDVAARLRDSLGGFESVYRLGGEEFVVVLPGTEIVAAVALAQRLRRAVSDTPVRELAVTISFGVSTSERGQPFDFETVFARADAALYKAKRSGRDRVCVGGTRREPVPDGDRPRAVPVLGDGEATAATGAGEAGPGAFAPDDGPERRRAIPEGGPGAWRAHVARVEAETGSWLVRDEIEREHLLALNQRLRRVFRIAAVIAFAGIAVAAPWYGWVPLVPPIIAAVVYNVTEYRLERLRRPEYALAGAWLLLQASVALGFALATGAPLFALNLFALMVIGSAAVFARRGVAIGVAYTALAMTGATLYKASAAVSHDPAILAIALAELVIIALIGWAVGQSAIDHRSESVVDHLTGLLNRSALDARAAELAHQSAVRAEPVAVIVTDLDRFKDVNDGHGHGIGDVVLREAAYRIRSCLRAFEAAYRIGGEEFVVLLAGLGESEAAVVAERVREAVERLRPGGHEVTASIGVAETGGGPLDFAALVAEADGALYRAKNAGRNAVHTATVVSLPHSDGGPNRLSDAA